MNPQTVYTKQLEQYEKGLRLNLEFLNNEKGFHKKQMELLLKQEKHLKTMLAMNDRALKTSLR